jgi:hypothetical protein
LSPSHLGRFTPRERASGTHWIGDSVRARLGLDDVERRKILGLPGLQPVAIPTELSRLERGTDKRQKLFIFFIIYLFISNQKSYVSLS